MKPSVKKDRSLPPCSFVPCKSRNVRHWIKDCPSSTNEQKIHLRVERTAKKAKRKDCSGRLQKKKVKKIDNLPSPSRNIRLYYDCASIDIQGRCDNGSKDSIISASVAKRATPPGIGKTTSIDTVHLRIALNAGEDAQSFSFSRIWLAP